MKKALIVVDMQKDFVDGSLGTPAAQSIVPAVVEKIRAFRGDALLVTLDTHGADYLQTLEGKKLPVPHCIKGTPGHALHSEIQAALSGKPHTLVEKNTFGSFDVARLLAVRCRMTEGELMLRLPALWDAVSPGDTALRLAYMDLITSL